MVILSPVFDLSSAHTYTHTHTSTRASDANNTFIYIFFSDENGEYTVFPPREGSGPSGSSHYFSADMDFTTFPGLILIGAA